MPKNFSLIQKIDEAISAAGVQQVARNWCFLCSTETIVSGFLHKMIPIPFKIQTITRQTLLDFMNTNEFIYLSLTIFFVSLHLQASAYCIDCNTNLCTFCSEAHRRQRTTSEHAIKSFIGTSKKSTPESVTSGMLLPATNYKCPIHIANDLVIFCINCQQVLCNECTILVHRGHKCVPIAKANKVYGKILVEHVERMRPAVEIVVCTKQTMNEISRKIHQRCDKVENDVEEFFAEYFDALERHKGILLKQISHVRQGRLETVLTAQAELDKRSEEIDQAMCFTEELLKSGNDIEMLSLVRILRKRFEYCQKLVTTSTNFKVLCSLLFYFTVFL